MTEITEMWFPFFYSWLSGNHWLSQWSQMSGKGTIVPSCFRGFAAQSSYRLWR